MLPYSCEYPSVPVVQFPSNNPPALPNVQVMQEAQPLLPFIAATIANEAGIYSGNTAARMFCYNMLSSNGWQNQAFSDIVKLAADACILKTRMGGSHTAATIAVDAVREVLVLFTSMLVVTYPELAGITPPQQVQAAGANYTVYNDLLNQINSMYQQTVPYTPPMARGAVAHPVASGRSTRPAQGVQPLSHGAASSIYSGNAQRQEPPKRFPSAKALQLAQFEEQAKAAEVKVVENNQTTSNIVSGEIEKMDRDQHTAVYFGKTFEIPKTPLRRKLEETVEANEVLGNKEDIESPVVNDVWVSETSFENLISTCRARSIAMSDESTKIYINYGLVVNPIVADADFSRLMAEASKLNTFEELAKKLSDYVDSGLNTQLLPEERERSISIVSQIDRVLTNVANNFLRNMIAPDKLAITSFIEDAGEISGFLNKKFGPKYNKLYMHYYRSIMNHLFAYIRSTGNEISQIYDYSDYGTKVHWDNIAVSYSVTYLSMLSKDIGYSVSDKEVREVRFDETPLLYRLLTSMMKIHDKTLQVSNHILITKDDVRYLIVPFSGSMDNFGIKEI